MSTGFGLIIVGDEILSGKRQDKHLPKVAELMAERGLSLNWAQVVGDDRARITSALRAAFSGADPVFCCGGIGATPDDHTRQCAAAALGVELELHPQAARLIEERMRDVAAEQGVPFEPERPDNVHRYNMGVFPVGATLIPNPYNKIPGFSCRGPGGAEVHFVPGFPVMAWPMLAWVLDQHYAHLHQEGAWREHSVIVMGAMEAALTPLMERIEAAHAVKVFSLPSVDHPTYGRHIELGVKGAAQAVEPAFVELLAGLRAQGAETGPELVRP
ncbi:MAG: competence/damage-inducible protein A [Hydrogenophaga sp.]|uniref:competence/damage-inducible protein A n=1 Tax=Hydrogenophaga sp. TaxID=1904254 RepID=UPI00169CDD04|nr:molybdopterin-binding protein [Hydrogenophaga sp.]NIM40634.1 competence/damage-inducible protein A [Hydrogenophaga sp.]NIN26109.1 competence/damage-inducible protein A [Hydrogenophaga sp.]NIN30974.1 competence/damage-inducible protein A [Hydrogenophaga sp.]NIN55017.1 competence/damage-inducible protein A [Hydrogenophaga sp.]NIO51060.1 competence/damage-inducible protein A [Hydrogenophaga sp.]